jgi:nucleoid DNA-binding protein
MEQLINLVAAKAGISPAQAKQAVHTVSEFLKEKLPAGINIESILSGGSLGNLTGGLKDMGNILGK